MSNIKSAPILTPPSARAEIDYDRLIAEARVLRADAFRDTFSALWRPAAAPAATPAKARLAGANA
jgi:hypothetical protein